MIKAVFFDLDDTLIDHNTAIRNAASTLFKKIIPNSEYELTLFQEQWISLTRKWYKQFFAKQVSFQESGRRRLREAFSNYGYQFSDTDADNLLSEYWEDYISKCQLFDDVVKCFAQLEKYKIGVLTNGQEAQQLKVLKRCGILPVLDVVVTSEAAGFAKPAPQIFQYACAKLGVQQTQSVYVGDNLELDAIAASDAGLIGIWLNRSHRNLGAYPLIVKQINGLNDLLKLGL
ncbi:HAD family hydrolase [Nostoc sp. DedQUE09]|uniref:HAD family hydrolase n=1 Tax=Nostoc sp. DedQUE09 TaxID=3075394 RepID=UPI002AD46A7E|nr:HAD family hydrolase [Nostoc sp. DedQUE09]MDZ7954143.1 HAD family hydrolase [Nostoc sp. DedQUE09]